MATRTLAGIQWSDKGLSGSEVDLRLHDLVEAAPGLVDAVERYGLRVTLIATPRPNELFFVVSRGVESLGHQGFVRGFLTEWEPVTHTARRLEALVLAALGLDWPASLVPEIPRGLTWWGRVRAWLRGVGR